MDFWQKGRRKGLKGDSDVTRENVHSKHRGAASSEVAESAAKESTFLLLFSSSPLSFPHLLQWPLVSLLPALPRENRFFFLSADHVRIFRYFFFPLPGHRSETSCSLRRSFEAVETGEPRVNRYRCELQLWSYKIIKVVFSKTRARQIIRLVEC